MSLLEELAYRGMLAREGQRGQRTEQKKARRKTVLAGPRIEPGVQRMSSMDCAAGWATLRLRSPLSQSMALTDEESDQLLGYFR